VEQETNNRNPQSPGEKIVKDIQRATRKQCSSSVLLRRRSGSILDGLFGEDSIAELCRREGVSRGVLKK
jgi:transposase